MTAHSPMHSSGSGPSIPNTEPVTVFNLASDEEMVFMLEPKEALVSAYMLGNSYASRLHDRAFRERLKAAITEGKTAYGLGDFAVTKPRELRHQGQREAELKSPDQTQGNPDLHDIARAAGLAEHEISLLNSRELMPGTLQAIGAMRSQLQGAKDIFASIVNETERPESMSNDDVYDNLREVSDYAKEGLDLLEGPDRLARPQKPSFSRMR